MLTTRATKRTGAERFALDTRMDVLEGEREIGWLRTDRRTGSGRLAVDGEEYAFTHTGGRGLGESPLELLVRAITHKAKPAPDHYELSDGAGRRLAFADQTREAFDVECEAGRLRFARGPKALLFAVTREGFSKPLGLVGQAKLLTTTMQIDLPDEISRPTQIFFLALLLELNGQRAANSGA